MKRILLAIALFAAAFAWTNDALPEVLEARYELARCNVIYAEDWIGMRESCAEDEEVPVFDADPYLEDMNDDLDDMAEAAAQPSQLEFGLAGLQLGVDSLDLLGAIFVDAFQNKTLPFFSCVRDGEKPLMEELDGCKVEARVLEQAAAHSYLGNELEHAEDIMKGLEDQGVETSGMQEIVDYGTELDGDIDAGFESGDNREISALYMRHSRLVLLFRLEQMLAVINYAEPIIEDSNNGNKEEILERGSDLRDDTEALLDECEYSAEVENNADYSRQNLECWDDAIDLYQEFNALKWLILGGA